MIKEEKKVCDCNTGEILAEDIVIEGIKLVSKNTVLNNYILGKLRSHYITEINVYKKIGQMKLDEINEQSYKEIKNLYNLSIMDIKDVINQIASGKALNYETIKRMTNLIVKLYDNASDVIMYLNSLKETDEYTYTHCINVALYSMLVGKWLSLSREEIQDLIQAGLLHDVGKLFVPEAILNKPGRLTEEEYSEMRRHTIYGYDIIKSNDGISWNAKIAILMHHERIDGSGYPLGLIDRELPIHTKIISVADAFDAMTSNRVYKKGVTLFKAFEIFLTEGVKIFDTTVLFSMLENISAYYIGMNVILDNGDIGEIVYIPPKNVLSPIVKVSDKFIDFSSQDISRIVKIF